MIRTALALLAGLLAGLTGMRYAAGLRRESLRLKRWDTLLSRLSLMMEEQAYTLPEALRRAADQPGEADALLLRVAAALESDRLASLSTLTALVDSALPEAAVITRLLETLGTGTLDMRMHGLSHAREELRHLSDAAAESFAKDAKMWSQLGWIGGACLVVLLV